MDKNNLVVIELDRARTLKFGNKALKKVEKVFGCKITNLKMNDLGIDEVEKLVLAGLEHEDKDLTLGMVSDLLDEHIIFGEALKLVTDAFTAAFRVKVDPKQVEEKKDLTVLPKMALDGTPLMIPTQE